MPTSRPLQIIVATLFALAAFAANSLLCRLALGSGAMDAASFTAFRLISGAAVLLLLLPGRGGKPGSRLGGGWWSAGLLSLYAITFSCAYISLSVGTGALILFGMVQATMILAALRAGERPRPGEWTGLLLALAGLVYLVSPGLAAPSPRGALFMAAAGVSWGLYSLRGRGSAAPLADTAGNFVRSVPLVLAASVPFLGELQLSRAGVLLALLSGGVTSGLGYVAWYFALPGLTATRAAVVQLSVPVLAALAGVLILAEEMTLRLLLAAVLILGGVGLAVLSRSAARKQ